MTQETKLKVVFAPGVLEQLEETMSPEDLQELLNQIQTKAEDGTLLEDSVAVDLDKLREEDPLEYELLMANLERQEEQDSKPFYLN